MAERRSGADTGASAPAGPVGGPHPRLRSDAWFTGDDEVAMEHRVAFATAGLEVSRQGGRPVIGIANSASELNPCNLPLRELAGAVRRGVLEAGGVPAEFGSISLGEDLMKPTAMLYRNLLAIEIEEMIRANPLDGIVILANCDKTVPGAIMGAASADIPTVVVTGGARPVAMFRGERIGTATALWRLWDERRTGRLDDDGWQALETCLNCGTGACNTMGTASTMALLSEALGLMVPGASTIPAGDPRALAAAAEAGRRAVAAVTDGLVPSAMLTPAAFGNAIRVLHAAGGSTNAIIHLAAIAGRVGVDLPLDELARLGAGMPVLADIQPSGAFLMQDFDAAGGLPALLRELSGLLNGEAVTVAGLTIGEIAAAAPAPAGAIRPLDRPLSTGGAFAVVRGSLAPDGAVIKTSAATPGLLRHRGPAVVFHGYEDMRHRVDDPALAVTADSVLVLRDCGPVGAGMPEWGMIPIPAKLAAGGVTDMVRVTDARMSGTSYGTVFLHAAPEAAVGGPLGLVADGDMISVDAEAGSISLDVPGGELARRRAAWTPPASPHLRGWPALYRDHVLQAPEGCDLDFLRAPTAAHRRFVEPVVGRS
ncbi:MAG TPA: dihydroxy-acid dehydratase [Streptosporangiaceae bacterium]|nr:dihydroxy-acid dehydratase [Streptosporangiaceae bacterium]